MFARASDGYSNRVYVGDSPAAAADAAQLEQHVPEEAEDSSSLRDDLPSDGSLSPALLQADAIRAAAIVRKKTLSSLFYENMDLHTAVEDSSFVNTLRESPDRVQYLQYLCYLHAGLKVAEELFCQSEELDLSLFYRTAALEADIASFGGAIEIVEPKILDHATHFNKLAQTHPKLLVAHLAMRYFAVLHGGQIRAERLKAVWGEDVTFKLYDFADTSQNLLKLLKEKLNNYGNTFSDDEYILFRREIILTWVYAGDCLGKDIRDLVKDPSVLA